MQQLSEFAKELNYLNLQYRDDIPKHLKEYAKENNIVILYGASDDLAEFEGGIDDEIGCWEGGVIATSPEIKAVWAKDYLYPCWKYETEIEHKTFLIWERGNIYCAGIVFYKPETLILKHG